MSEVLVSAPAGKKILIIEDDAIIARIYQNRLTREGYTVSVASEGQDGFFAIIQDKPDAVLLDLMLPHMDGVQILKKTRAQRNFQRMPIIVFSNAYMNGLLQDASDAGASLVFNKSEPGAIDNIVRGFNDCLTARRPSMAAPVEIPEVVEEKPAATPLEIEAALPAPKPVIAPTAKVAAAKPVRFGVVPIGKQAPKARSIEQPIEAAAKPISKQDTSAPSNPPTELDLLNVFFDGGAQTMATIRGSVRAFCKDPTNPEGRAHLHGLYRQIHSLTGVAGIASQCSMGNFSSCLEAFLRELLEQKKPMQPSALRTLANAVDMLGVMFQQGGRFECVTVEEAAVLVVDDEMLFQRLVSLALEKATLKTYSANSAQTALKMLKERAYELIVLDVNLPDANGFDLCGQIRQMPGYENTPICFITGMSDFQSRAKSIMCGGNDFISKPISSIEMTVKALSHVLTGRIGQGAETVATA